MNQLPRRSDILLIKFKIHPRTCGTAALKLFYFVEAVLRAIRIDREKEEKE